MSIMLMLSLIINVAVLVPVCLGLLTGADWTTPPYGPATPARGILLSIYLAILVISSAVLAGAPAALAPPLLLVQIVYKITTPFTVGRLRNPVVLSNLAIAAFHGATLAVIWS
jgi:hypothetical protein